MKFFRFNSWLSWSMHSNCYLSTAIILEYLRGGLVLTQCSSSSSSKTFTKSPTKTGKMLQKVENSKKNRMNRWLMVAAQTVAFSKTVYRNKTGLRMVPQNETALSKMLVNIMLTVLTGQRNYTKG